MTRVILAAGIAVLAAIGVGPQLAGAQTVRSNMPRPVIEPRDPPPEPRIVPPGPASLAVSVGYGRVEFDVNQRLAYAKATQVPLSLKFTGGGTVVSLQTGVVSILLGTHSGGFEQSFPNLDIRQLLSGSEAAILERCNTILGPNQVESAESAYDVQIAFTVNAPTGAVVASTTVPYQLGLSCKRIPPLIVSIGYAKIEFSVALPLANAWGGQAPVTVKYNGPGNAVSLQVGRVSMLLGSHNGSFEQTIPNADTRSMLSKEEAAIRNLCQSLLDANNVAAKETVYDARLAMTVNAPSGAVLASTTVPYQLGLTCKR